MLLTLKILFTPDSTEGVEMEQITAMRNEKTAHVAEETEVVADNETNGDLQG